MRKIDLIVVGGGIGGAAAALRAAQYQMSTVWIMGDKQTAKGSRSHYVKNIDNMIGVHPDIILDKVAELLEKEHPDAADLVASTPMDISTKDIIANARARIEAYFPDYVEIVERSAEDAEETEAGFSVTITDGISYEGSSLLLATGVMDCQPVIHKEKSGRDLSSINWVFPYANEEMLLYCIRCEGHLAIDRTVGMIGSGNPAAECAIMIRERYGSSVVILTAGKKPSWDEEKDRLLAAFEIEVVEGKLIDVLGGDKGATLNGFVVEGGRVVNVDMAQINMGLFRVYNDLARMLGAELEKKEIPDDVRHVLVDSFGETSVSGLFAVGDMSTRESEPMMKQIYTAQEYAVRAVDTVDRRRRLSAREAI